MRETIPSRVTGSAEPDIPAAWEYELMLRALPVASVAPPVPPDPPALADELAANRRRAARR
jgi:hypothetical protein